MMFSVYLVGGKDRPKRLKRLAASVTSIDLALLNASDTLGGMACELAAKNRAPQSVEDYRGGAEWLRTIQKDFARVQSILLQLSLRQTYELGLHNKTIQIVREY